MNVLVIGNGAREHALAWKLAQSPRVERVFVAPGNPGTAGEPRVENVDVAATDFDALVAFAKQSRVGLTIVGPEIPLVAGIRDRFDREGLKCFGPTQAAARLEGSKAFAKDFLARHRIPTAGYRVFTAFDAAAEYVRERGAPIVVKADGLAAGKGVVVARTVAEALEACDSMLSRSVFGESGRRVVIEDCLVGEEASFICIVDGERALPFATSQDHKARDDGDIGPNTGGLGAYSPAPVVTPEVRARILERVIEPTVRGIAADGARYQGFLYAGLMITETGDPYVIEFNCRFGDPECQPIMLRLKSDLVALCEAALAGELDRVSMEWDPRPALAVVMAAGGYPGAVRSGDQIDGIAAIADRDVKVFQAGTRKRDNRIVTDGGRVLTVAALGRDIADAQRRAYDGVARISFKDAYFRRDIGYRAVARH